MATPIIEPTFASTTVRLVASDFISPRIEPTSARSSPRSSRSSPAAHRTRRPTAANDGSTTTARSTTNNTQPLETQCPRNRGNAKRCRRAFWRVVLYASCEDSRTGCSGGGSAPRDRIRSVERERSAGTSVWRGFALGLSLMVLFLVTWVGQGIAQWQTHADEQQAHANRLKLVVSSASLRIRRWRTGSRSSPSSSRSWFSPRSLSTRAAPNPRTAMRGWRHPSAASREGREPARCRVGSTRQGLGAAGCPNSMTSRNASAVIAFRVVDARARPACRSSRCGPAVARSSWLRWSRCG